MISPAYYGSCSSVDSAWSVLCSSHPKIRLSENTGKESCPKVILFENFRLKMQNLELKNTFCEYLETKLDFEHIQSVNIDLYALQLSVSFVNNVGLGNLNCVTLRADCGLVSPQDFLRTRTDVDPIFLSCCGRGLTAEFGHNLQTDAYSKISGSAHLWSTRHGWSHICGWSSCRVAANTV